MVDQLADHCHSCGSQTLIHIPEFRQLKRVTSDCKPWHGGGSKAICQVCGLVQSVINPQWKEECHSIYNSYTVYHQSDGVEQPVFVADRGGVARSARLLRGLQDWLPKPENGRALDIGCGNGNFLRSLSAFRPNWQLSGAEYNSLYEDIVRSIPRVEAFYSGDISEVKNTFELISLIHVLEHISDPVPFLKNLHRLTSPEGRLLIEVPFFPHNPFELLITDHASHYTEASLRLVLDRAGWSCEHIQTDLIPKELTVIAKPSGARKPDPLLCFPQDDALPLLRRSVDSLLALRIRALGLQNDGIPLAIFGTSIGGTWMAHELGGDIVCFVDEDPCRIGRNHLGLPVRAISDLPSDVTLLLPLAPCSLPPLLQRITPHCSNTLSLLNL